MRERTRTRGAGGAYAAPVPRVKRTLHAMVGIPKSSSSLSISALLSDDHTDLEPLSATDTVQAIALAYRPTRLAAAASHPMCAFALSRILRSPYLADSGEPIPCSPYIPTSCVSGHEPAAREVRTQLPCRG